MSRQAVARVSWTIVGVVVLILAVAASAGCSVRVYSRAVEGTAPHAEPVAGSRIAVVADEGVEPEPSTIDKIETLLVRQGFAVVPPDESDFLMLYHYEVTDHGLGRGIEPLSGAASGIRTSERPGPWDHTLHVRLIEAPAWREAGETRLVWAGVARVASAPTGGSRFLDIALVCALDDVGEGTGDTVADRVRVHDRRARDLR